jgi:uncharacterized protein YecE (DUF72 family)
MIRIGTCSWTEKSLLQSGQFYPKQVKTAEERLRYYAAQFNTVEIDATYYAIPDKKMAWLWDVRTPDSFTFHIKAYGALTGHGINPKTLPPSLKGLLPVKAEREQLVMVKEPQALEALASAMLDALTPLSTAGKIGLMVFQYPRWFTYTGANLDYILYCKELMKGLRVGVEFRHGSWFGDERAKEIFKFLRSNGLAYIVADEPQYGNLATIPFLPAVTSDISYFRFHGRNNENWLKKGIETSQRYAYEYSDEELRDFVSPLVEAGKKAKTTYAMFNNCYTGYAVRNALRMKQLLGIA